MLRASVFAVVAVHLAALGHALAGGGLPDPAVLLTVTLFVGAAVASLATQRRTGPQILGMMILSQLAFHAVFEVTATHAGHVAATATVDTGQMLAAHLAAALATSWLLTGGESALFRFWATLSRVLVRRPRIIVVPALPTWTVLIDDGTGALRLLAGDLSLISRRGPPRAL